MAKLNQILAIEKGIKSRVYAQFSRLHQATQKPGLMNGFKKSYQPKDEEGESFPSEAQKVQYEYGDVFKQVNALLSELFDVTASKDWANCKTTADVMVDGRLLVGGAPPPFLLFLEKQLSDLHTLVSKMAEVDAGEDWSEDPTSGLLRSESRQTHKTKKVQRPLVLFPATKEHPAQTQLITEDVVVGSWHTIKYSGAIPPPRKALVLERIQKLTKAVKFAREKANAVEAPKERIGETIFGYLFE